MSNHRVCLMAVLIVGIGAGCAGDSQKSGCVGNCAGCCTEKGICVAGTTPPACGVGGDLCTECPSGQTCSSGTCKGSTGSCTAANCAGCCTAAGVCVAGSTASACGTGGSLCGTCAAGAQCVNGACGGTCSSATCTGCCSAQGCLVATQQTAAACGSGGNPCSACAGGSQCTNGYCAGGTCNSAICPTGCCTAQGQCLPFNQQNVSACGSAGALCGQCQANAQCTNGVCQGGTCNNSNCAGCCTAQSTCLLVAQQSISACGAGGAPCTACQGGAQCTNGYCSGTTGCSAANCPQGCCWSGTQCLAFTQQSVSACGKAGAVCQQCTSGMSCADGACGVFWNVWIDSAEVEDKPTDDWDTYGLSGSEPDPMAILTVKADNKTGQTNFINDTFSPKWVTKVLADTEQNLTSPLGIVCEVREDDSPLGSEAMGQCSGQLTSQILNSGTYFMSNCSSYVTSVVLKFTK